MKNKRIIKAITSAFVVLTLASSITTFAMYKKQKSVSDRLKEEVKELRHNETERTEKLSIVDSDSLTGYWIAIESGHNTIKTVKIEQHPLNDGEVSLYLNSVKHFKSVEKMSLAPYIRDLEKKDSYSLSIGDMKYNKEGYATASFKNSDNEITSLSNGECYLKLSPEENDKLYIIFPDGYYLYMAKMNSKNMSKERSSWAGGIKAEEFQSTFLEGELGMDMNQSDLKGIAQQFKKIRQQN